MFIKILICYLIGYLRISVEGYYVERFINICTNNRFTIWKLKRINTVKVDLNIRLRDFKNILKIAQKTKCKIKIKRKKGLPFILHKYRKRKIFTILLLILMGLIMLSSNFIWNIEIKEENGEEISNILEDLEEKGLKKGEWKSNINTKEIINNVRLKRNDIAWMGIELNGTNAIVKITKAKEKPNIIDENEYCNIISDKTGIITKINAQNGTANVKVGDTVTKGNTLIYGWMEGKYTGLRYLHAKGEIQAKVWHTKNKKIYYKQTIKEETGRQENKYNIKINIFKINFNKRVSKFEIYDTISTEKNIKIFSDFYLPISIEKVTYKEQKNIEKTYGKEEAKNIGIRELELELEEEIKNKENIINKNINTHETEQYTEVYVTYEVLEDIGTEEKIVF